MPFLYKAIPENSSSYRLPKSWLHFCLLTALFFSIPKSSLCQIEHARFEHIGSREGLPHVSVQAILQDRYGYLWVGTYGGLCRYDGYNFQCYFAEIFDPNSLSHNNIHHLHEDPDGSLWASAESGINRYDRFHDHFIRYSSNCRPGNICGGRNQFISDNESGRLWTLSTLGKHVLQAYYPEKDSFSKISLQDTCFLEQTHPKMWKSREGIALAASATRLNATAAFLEKRYFPIHTMHPHYSRQ
ncbi:MAG: two-component regulator propeller domain-containing protein [Bacteroidia bacterium]